MAGEIENKEIRGVTAKTIVWFFGSSISIIISITFSYLGLKADIKDARDIQTNTAKIQDIIINNLKAQTDLMQAQMKEINIRVANLEYKESRK